MKLLLASHLYPQSVSRTSGSFVHAQARFLQARCAVRVVAPLPYFPFPGFGQWSAYRRVPRHELLDGVEVARPRYVTLPRRLFYAGAWRSYLRALERTAAETPDVIHAHCAYPDGRAAVEYGRRVGRPVVVMVHGYGVRDVAADRRWRPLVQEALGRADRVIAVSQGLADEVKALCPAVHLEQVPNGVDCQIFTPDLARRPGEGGWQLLYVGRFDVAKGIGVLLEALARLDRDDVRLTLIGGNAATGAAAPFRQQADRLGLGQRVVFGDEVPSSELPQHMRRADVFVLPSFSEGFPVTLLEAMACGLPIVSTRCGGPEEIVAEEVGRLAVPRDVDGLAQAIGGLLDDYRQYDRRAIRQRAERLYDYRAVAGRLCQLYDGLQAGGG